MSDTYLTSLLGENEKILLVSRKHWFFLLSTIILEILLLLLIIFGVTFSLVNWSGAVSWIGWVALGYFLAVIPIASLLRDILIWTNEKYIVTNRRVMQVRGIVNKNVTDSSLEKVNDVKMAQSFLGRLFDFGDVEILTASELGVNLFKHIADPVRFKTTMLNAKLRLETIPENHVAASADIPAVLARLGDLRQKGVLTEEEFQQMKSVLLKKI